MATDSTSSSKPLRIAIIGAGIGGLAFAAALANLIPEGILKVDVYEQAHEVKEIGAGILAWPRTWNVLQSIGVAEALEKHLPKKPDNERRLVWKIIKSDQPQGTDIYEFYINGAPSHFHRAALQKTLLDSLPTSIQVHLGHHLVSYDETDQDVTLNFENKEPIVCNLLVAADGIKSGIRGEFLNKRFPDQQESIHPIWGGAVIYRTLIDAQKVREEYPQHHSLSKTMMYAGDGQYSVTYPIMQGKFVNVATLVTDFSKEGTRYDGPTTKVIEKDYVLSLFKGWSEQYMGLMKHAESFAQWTIEFVNPLKSFAVGRVALLGDAAHAMTPNLGSGAGQGIERTNNCIQDAYILAHLIRKATEKQIPISRVTEVYSENRQPLANYVLKKSDDLGRLASFRFPGYEGIKDANDETMKALIEKFALDFEGLFDWWESHPVEKEVEKTLNML
ncbi:hypothetical protein BDQ17DRAFT_1312808 [Cyathus striatus]|nr:hypothetical protein BDQ17DRAFT_1312808 [Cyathus striatus]